MDDPYSILGLSRSASAKEIKASYRALAKKFHPDLNPGDKQAEAKFKALSGAYEKIGTSDARARFDRGEVEERASHDWSQQEGGADFFEQILRQQSRRRRPTEFPGEDHLFHLDVEFKDAALGAEREIILPGGKRLSIKIPAGIQAGAKLRFKAMGGAGAGGGPPGDAFVEISIKPLEGFARIGKNIETELALSFQEAILGAELKVPTLEGQVLLAVPAGSSTGTRLRIRGKGVGSGPERGDQIVVVRIVVPKVPGAALQEAVRGLGAAAFYDPRGASQDR
jgi:DnaJ-class molecular chaperone